MLSTLIPTITITLYIHGQVAKAEKEKIAAKVAKEKSVLVKAVKKLQVG